LTGIAAGDFNGDGKADLAITTNDGNSGITTVAIYISNGDGTFREGASYSFAASNPPFAIATDLNHDRKLDLAVTNGGTVEVLLGNGDGTFQNPVSFPVSPMNAKFLAAADFNSDGNVDLAVAGDFGVSILLGNGDGTFRPHMDTTTVSAFGPPAVADFNADGKLDLAINSTGAVQVLIGKGDGTFETPVLIPATPPLAVVAGDFNSDGFADLAAPVNFPSGPSTVSVFLSTPAVDLFPSSLKFGAQAVGASSESRRLSLTNIGNGPLSDTDATTSGDYSQTNTCGVSLKPGTSCAATVTFTPTASGLRTGTVTFTDNALSSPQLIALTGSGTTSAVMLSPSSLTFPAQRVGSSSKPETVTLKNTGSATLILGSIAVSGDFSQSNNCGSSVAPGKDCTISVTFKPATPGPHTGTVSITGNAPGSPQRLSVAGTGT
jgi:hypothetical protein